MRANGFPDYPRDIKNEWPKALMFCGLSACDRVIPDKHPGNLLILGRDLDLLVCEIGCVYRCATQIPRRSTSLGCFR
jgi:hypothetical protein